MKSVTPEVLRDMVRFAVDWWWKSASPIGDCRYHVYQLSPQDTEGNNLLDSSG